GSMTRKVRLLNEMCPESLVEINPSDADKLGIGEGDRVRIASRRGDFVSKVKITDKVSSGVVFAKFHFAEAPVNLLTNTVLDPESKIPDLKFSTVRVEKFNG
ncbi:MAG: molybdopterin dinucleotide binding domain-containing protein, partial [Deltaproteobacteria bacterium]|nr:molybdopterin dinucleotide binding domain-containing protein [Deltaproteobacteria bacterium]